jgi:membrane protease YdiL (CAAX protease family)
MKKAGFFFLIITSFSVNAQTDSTAREKPEFYPRWTLFVPGATHFHDNRIAEGIIFSGTTVGGITLGIIYDNKLKTNSSTPYYNFPLLLGMQAYNVDKCDWFRNRLEVFKYYRPDFKYDPIKFSDLLKTPYQAKNIFKPITGGLILFAIAELYLGRGSDQNYKDIDQMYFVDRYMNKNAAMALYGAASLGASYGAGIGEEYMFRNTIMPMWDYKYGQKRGLIYSSLFFGSMHFGNLLFSKNPDYKATLLQVGEASILGYILGKDVQNRGYNIGPAVAAHMWYDFTLMLGSFLIDPKNNYLGVNMKFKM